MSSRRFQYAPLLRRRREGKTDYRRRKAVLLSHLPFLSVSVSGKNVLVQFVSPGQGGDKVIASAHSRELLKYGWTGSRKGTPAAYLTGLLAGLKARGKVDKAILYTGLRPFVHGSRITAALKGILDAGISMPVDPKTLPTEERLTGGHIASYAKRLLEGEKSLYNARFSSLIKAGFRPEEYPSYVREVRERLMKGFEVKGK